VGGGGPDSGTGDPGSTEGREFFDLGELNECIREELLRLNNRPFQNLPGCRRSVFKEV